MQAAREAARRAQCANHLKQFGLAFANHHDINKFFPSGGVSWTWAPDYNAGGQPERAPMQRAGWGFQILPFLEQRIVWEGAGGATNDDRQRNAMGTPIPNFFCPSRRSPQAPTANSWYPTDNTSGYGPSGTYNHAFTDYACCCSENDGAVISTSFNSTTGVRDWANGGPISTATLIDGTANTMLVGEKRLNLQFIGQFQSDDNEGYTSGWDHDMVRSSAREPWPDFVASSGYGDSRFGSSHPGGFQTVFADGAVHFIPYSVELTVFRRMGKRNDRESFQFP